MPLYSQESLLRLRERIDLVEVLSRYMELKRSGATFKGLCPFHDEKTPSFMVKRGDRHYHCFGCGAHGDAIEFLMHYLHLSFQEAIEQLAEFFHIQLERVEKVADRGPDKGKLKEALAFAHSFFRHCLLKTEEGKPALHYLASRQIGVPFIERFALGYAPSTSFRQVMYKKGFTEEILQVAGLLSSEGRPFFRERITFAIHNAVGAIIGFSARKFKEETFGGKYINSPDTPLFKKSKTLFGFHFTRRRIAKERKVIVVEGQIDCLRLIEASWEMTVAALGTAFTEEHVSELKALGVLEAILLFDGDKSGRQAASKVGHLFQKQGIDVKVALLPASTDPDDFICKRGKHALDELLSQSVSYLPFQLSFLSEQYDIQRPASKSELIRLLSGQIREWQDPVMVHESLKRLSALTQVPESLIIKEPLKISTPPKSSPLRGGSRALECDLLRWLLFGEDTKLVELIRNNLCPEDFLEADCRSLFEAFFRMTSKGFQKEDRIALLTELGHTEMVAPLIEELGSKKINKKGGPELAVRTIQGLLDRRWLQQREAIQKEIASDNLGGEKLDLLVKEFDRLKKNRPKVNGSSSPIR